MAYLVHPLPARKVWVKKEYLYDLEKGHGELTPGLWISVRSIQAKALYFETLLTDYGALFDKLPLSAFVWKQDINWDDQLPLDVLELWDCLITISQLLRNLSWVDVVSLEKTRRCILENMNLQ
mgnify:CR=1 FL=1